jgi:hypothetical protein
MKVSIARRGTYPITSFVSTQGPKPCCNRVFHYIVVVSIYRTDENSDACSSFLI